eukprot:658223-Amphidinium_carterae.2
MEQHRNNKVTCLGLRDQVQPSQCLHIELSFPGYPSGNSRGGTSFKVSVHYLAERKSMCRRLGPE